ncbi:MAG: rodA, partial [Acidimicrobiaceae bacterium]
MTSILTRRPDSGLGNLKSSPSDPTRNIDWFLMLLQAALATIGCFVIYSASRTKQDDPFLFVTRQVV